MEQEGEDIFWGIYYGYTRKHSVDIALDILFFEK